MSNEQPTRVIVKLPNVRINFSKLFKAEGYQGSTENPKFSSEFYLDPENEQHTAAIKKLKKEIDRCGREKFGGKWGKIKMKGFCLKSCNKDLFGEKYVSEYEPESGEIPEHLENVYIVRASESKRPDVRDIDKGVLTEEDGKIYDGCVVTGLISLWAQDNKFGKRINANLIGVQFKRDDEAFAGDGGGRVHAADDDWDNEDDDDMMD